MTQEIDPSTFQKYIKTTEDMTYLLSLLGSLSSELFKKDRSFGQILEQDISYQKGFTIKKIAAAHQVDLENASEVVNFLNKLSEKINALPIVTITLAFSPRADLVTNISQWFTVNFGQPVILNIKVDPTLMAGSVISFNGKIKDYSLKQQLFSAKPEANEKQKKQ